MKHTEFGLSISLDDQKKTIPMDRKVSMLLTGAALTFGIWGMGRAFLPGGVLFAALAVLCIGIFIDPKDLRQVYGFTAAGVIVLVQGMVFRSAIASGLGAMGNEIVRILTARMGYYFHHFETQGETIACDMAAGIVLGALVSAVVRCSNPIPMLMGTVGVLLLNGLGVLQKDLFLAVYLLGVLLIFAKNAAGDGKGIFWTAGIALALSGAVLLIGNALDIQPEISQQVESRLHRWRYEKSDNPLPEGQLSEAGRRVTTDDAALEITMEQWQSVYLRGFIGSQYTGSGWEEEAQAVLAESADLLYTLQKNYFHPDQQLAAVNDTLGYDTENQIRVRVLGACKAYSYLPYGIGGVALDEQDLTRPKLDAYTGALYAVDEAYLLQKELSDGSGSSDYLDAEAAYRSWVYGEYLELPDEVASLMTRELGAADPAMTTTQIKELVLQWVDRTLTYDEYASTQAVGTDLAEYLVSVSSYGYDVHYATLATLALRHMGIPARYVEGYLVPQSLAGTMGAGEALILTQEYAHAWVEYYLDGIGWIPFEVTPGYENELVYHLPPDGTGVQAQNEVPETQPDTDEPPVKQEPDEGSLTKLHATKIVRNVLLGLLVLAVLAFIIRVILLRRRLKARMSRFREETSRESMLDCLHYQFELLSIMGLPKRNVTLAKREWDISQLLFGDSVGPLLLTAQELSFSQHPVSQDQHDQILTALDRTLEVWKRKTPWYKRLREKWIRCRVL